MLLLDGNGLSTAPGRIISLAADDLVGTDADIVLLLSQLGHGLGGSLGLDRLSTLEVLLGAILNLITSDGSCLLDGDLSLLALDVGSLGDLGCLDDDLCSGLVGRADDLAAISAADDQIIGTALLGGSGDYVFLLCCCCSVLASSGDLNGSNDFLVTADLAGVDHVVMAILGAGRLYIAFFIGDIDPSADVAIGAMYVGSGIVRNSSFDLDIGLLVQITLDRSGSLIGDNEGLRTRLAIGGGFNGLFLYFLYVSSSSSGIAANRALACDSYIAGEQSVIFAIQFSLLIPADSVLIVVQAGSVVSLDIRVIHRSAAILALCDVVIETIILASGSFDVFSFVVDCIGFLTIFADYLLGGVGLSSAVKADDFGCRLVAVLTNLCISNFAGCLASSSIVYECIGAFFYFCFCFCFGSDLRGVGGVMLAGGGDSGVRLFAGFSSDFDSILNGTGILAGSVRALNGNIGGVQPQLANIGFGRIGFIVAIFLNFYTDFALDGFFAVGFFIQIQMSLASLGNSNCAILRNVNCNDRLITRNTGSSKRGNLQETDTHGQDQDQRLQTFGRVLHDTFSSLFLKFSQ